MFERLQRKWKVSPGRLFLILLTFAVGGSLCGYLGRKILGLIFDGRGVLWVLAYILLITLLWPICVIVISVFTGQFNFFRAYLAKMGRRMTGRKPASDKALNIAIFASGTGTNAEQLIRQLPQIRENAKRAPAFRLILTDNPVAKVLQLAERESIPSVVIKPKGFSGEMLDALYLDILEPLNIDLIILAGYLKQIPPGVIARYRGRIVNIHPALLPAYGGKGMYGHHVHEAVIRAKEKQSGISIHLVDEIYDNGEILLQEKVEVDESDTAESLAKKIQVLEHLHYSPAIAKLIATF